MISTHVNEEGTIRFTLTLVDDEGVEHNVSELTSANFQLSDLDGNVIPGLSFDENPMNENSVVLTCKDLAIGDYGTYRIFAIEMVYDSTYGDSLCAKEEIKFKINNLVNFPR